MGFSKIDSSSAGRNSSDSLQPGHSAISAYLTIHHFDPYLLDILDDYKLSFTRSFS